MRTTIALAVSIFCSPVLVFAAQPASTNAVQDNELTVVLNAVQDCQPECALKQYTDFKRGIDDYFDQDKSCEAKFNVYLKQKNQTLSEWYARECVVQCMRVVGKEFSDDEDVKGQIGSGAFGFWASKGAIETVKVLCTKGR